MCVPEHKGATNTEIQNIVGTHRVPGTRQRDEGKSMVDCLMIRGTVRVRHVSIVQVILNRSIVQSDPQTS